MMTRLLFPYGETVWIPRAWVAWTYHGRNYRRAGNARILVELADKSWERSRAHVSDLIEEPVAA